MKIKVTDLVHQDRSQLVDVPFHGIVIVELRDGTRIEMTEVLHSDKDKYFLMVRTLGHNQSSRARMAVRLEDQRTISIGREDA